MKSICFMIDTPILKFYLSYYVIDAFINAGYQIQWVDISPVTNPEAHQSCPKDMLDYQEFGVRICRSYKEIDSLIEGLEENCIVVSSGSWDRKHYPIYKSLAKRKHRYGYMILNSCYELASQEKGVNRLKRYIERLTMSRVADSIFRRLPKSLYRGMACSFLINNSAREIEDYKKRFFCDDDTQYLVVHSNTYEEALSYVKEERIVKEKYCVWMDSYVPYHPDLAQIGAKVDAKEYYAPLRKFFSWIQKNYKVRVIISAHPRSDYTKHPDAYEGFEIIKGKSCLLVRDAEFVLSAASTSFLYAITYQKPILFIYQNALVQELHSHIIFIDHLCKELNQSPLNIDEFDYQNKEMIDKRLRLDADSYKACANDYISEGFDGKLTEESYSITITDFLDRL